MAVSTGRSNKLTIAGILNIVAGVAGIVIAALWAASGGDSAASETNGAASSTLWIMVILTSIIPSAIAVVGGYFALQRKNFWVAILGGIAALLFAPTFGYQGIPLGAMLPLAAVVLIALSRKEFPQKQANP